MFYGDLLESYKMTAVQHKKIELEAQARTVLGGKVAALRRSGYMPAVLYGKGQKAISLQVQSQDFKKALHEAGESTLVYVRVGPETYPTIIHDVARDPVNDGIIHADFYKVSLSEKIKAKIPVIFTGESPAVKDSSGIFVRNINELEVEALPQNLPHELTVDISVLKNFGDRITVSDLKRGLGGLVELTAVDSEAIVATVQEPKSQEELDAELAAPTAGVEEVKVIEKEKKEEEGVGEEAAEGKENQKKN